MPVEFPAANVIRVNCVSGASAKQMLWTRFGIDRVSRVSRASRAMNGNSDLRSPIKWIFACLMPHIRCRAGLSISPVNLQSSVAHEFKNTTPTCLENHLVRLTVHESKVDTLEPALSFSARPERKYHATNSRC